MDGAPNACGRLRASGKPVTGLSMSDLVMCLIFMSYAASRGSVASST